MGVLANPEYLHMYIELFSRMDNGNGAEGFTAVNDLSIDNHTFDQHIDAQQSARSIAQPNTTNLGTSLLTAEGQIETVHSYGDENTRFIRIQRQPTEVDGAYFCNILPVPALDCYEHMQPPSEKIGKFMKHPEMYRLEKRLESFKIYRWPLLNPSPSALAKAGYFFEGMPILSYYFQ